ncbi:hypothetical protein CEXT_238491 [Caerostris extrusa]|uniref:Uncharacterized protein n=1 Tax=Caerostris extrusa TaxID=172846 RepID=A0AAV4T6K5_CAEEX|nr:hypothetical protein CEXT_238491 [Caerostris extrusa]
MSNKGPHVKMGNRVPKELDKQLPFMGCKLGRKKSFVPIFSKWILNYEIVFDKLAHGNCALETKLRWSGHRERMAFVPATKDWWSFILFDGN